MKTGRVAPAFVAVVVGLLLVGASVPASAGGLLGWLFGSDKPTVAQFVTPTCKVSVTPRDLDFNVRQFAFQMPDGVAVQPVWDLRIPIAKSEVQVITGILELTPGSGEITKVELTLDGQRDAFIVIEPPDVVEDRELWLRDSVALLRGQHRQRGYRLGREVFPPFVSVGKYDKRPNGPVIFATPISQLEFGAHSITARVTTKGGGQQVAEAVVEFLIIPDPSGMVDLNRVPGSLAMIPAVQQAPTPSVAPPVPPTPRPPDLSSGYEDIKLQEVMKHVGFTGDPTRTSSFRTSVVQKGHEGATPIVIVLRDPQSAVVANGHPMKVVFGYCIIWCKPPGMQTRFDIDGSPFWQGNAPASGEGLWLVQ